MTIDEMLALCGWFARWQTPAGPKFGCRPIGGGIHQWFIGSTPREALEKMVQADGRLPNWELFE